MPGRLIGHIPELQSGSDDGEDRSYDHSWLVLTDLDNTAYVAGGVLGLPKLGQLHWEDPQATCIGISPKPKDGETKDSITPGKLGLYWIVTTKYTTNQDLKKMENPLSEPAKVTWSGGSYKRMVQTNKDNEVVTNGALVPVKPFEKDENRAIAKVKKNVMSIPVAAVTTWSNTINQSGFQFQGLNILPKTAKYKFEGLSDFKIRNGISYREYTFSLHFRADWRKLIPSKGRYELKDDGTGSKKHYPVLDGNGVKIASDVPLKPDGSHMIIQPTTTPSDIPVIKEDIMEETDFGQLQSFYA